MQTAGSGPVAFGESRFGRFRHDSVTRRPQGPVTAGWRALSRGGTPSDHQSKKIRAASGREQDVGDAEIDKLDVLLRFNLVINSQSGRIGL